MKGSLRYFSEDLKAETCMHDGSTSSDYIITPGEYEAQCIKYREFYQFRGPKLCLEWDFTLSGKQGLILPQYFNMAHKSFKDSTYYYKCWVIANNLQKPRRRTRKTMSPKIFLNITATVFVVTVIPKYPNTNTPMPAIFHYPKVEFIKELTTTNNYCGVEQ
ncbi:MAG: hypothetical protein ABIH76_09130 [Candidatus Bathyarchaeota archaeon]